MFDYTAPNPYQRKQTGFFSSLFSSSGSFSNSFSPSIGRIVLPSQGREPRAIRLNDFHYIYNNDLAIDFGVVNTYDGANLETIEIMPNCLSEVAEKNKKYIIKFNGNGGLYQDYISAYAYDASQLQSAVIGFNYRGVGDSLKEPKIFQELVTDGLSQVQRLLDKGVKPKSILLDGHSLGGAVATIGASHLHNIEKPVYLWNDRSLASISKAAAGFIAPYLPGLSEDSYQSTVATSLSTFMYPSGWDADLAEAYQGIPTEFKSYMYVAKESDESAGDGVISHPASLHKGVKLSEKEEGISTGYKVLARNSIFGHNLRRSELIYDVNTNLTGQDLFEGFAKRLGTG